MIMRGSLLLLLSLLGKTAAEEFVSGKPGFFADELPAPLAYYYLNEGSGYDLKESVSNNPTAGTVIFEAADQINSVHTHPNWVNDAYFGKTIGCGAISNKDDPEAGTIQKDVIRLEDINYGYSGQWAFSVWFRHEAGVNFPNYEREQFFGHGDPDQPTTSVNQVHVQFEKSGAIRTIIKDGDDADLSTYIAATDTSADLKLEDGNWHHLVVTTRDDFYDGYNVYVDGVLQASSPMGEGNSNPTDADVWLAAGGDPIDPVGPIRLCGREKEDGFDDKRYFRGQVAHFAVWNKPLSHLEVATLYLDYTSRYGIPQIENVPGSNPTTASACPEVVNNCDFCDGEIVNPLAVIDVAGFPPGVCGTANFDIPNLGCLSGLTPESACAAASPVIYDICCVPDESGSLPAAAPSPSSTESSGVATGAIVGIVVGVLFVIGLVVLAVFKSKSSVSYDTNSPEFKAAVEDRMAGQDSTVEGSRDDDPQL